MSEQTELLKQHIKIVKQATVIGSDPVRAVMKYHADHGEYWWSHADCKNMVTLAQAAIERGVTP